MASGEGVRLGGEAARRLARTGQYEIGPGLTDAEFARVWGDYGFEFADDHRAFLAAGLPLNRPPEEGQAWLSLWPDWRDGVHPGRACRGDLGRRRRAGHLHRPAGLGLGRGELVTGSGDPERLIGRPATSLAHAVAGALR